jgi:hypothetical protein
MKIPDKLEAFGQTWVIKKDKSSRGTFDFDKLQINIGTRFNEGDMVFFHELLEASAVDNHCRFMGIESGQELMFIMNHTQFTKVVKDFVAILRQNKLI